MTTDLPTGPHPDWATASTDVLAAGVEPPPRRASWPLVAGAAALVLALVGGVTYAVGALSGGGQQAAEALPTGAFGLVSVDLDPPAGQKVDAFRFLRKFPTLRERVPLDGDVRELVFDALADEVGWDDIDFANDVAPWLGKRLAVAAYPPAGDGAGPVMAVALQVTDTTKADAGLRRLASAAQDGTADKAPVGWAFSGDYALITETASDAQALADSASGSPLAEDPHFAADTAAAGAGIVLAWADFGRVSEALAGAVPSPLLLGGGAMPSGRTTLVARFDGPDVFEVTGSSTGVVGAGWASHEVRGMADLPRTTAAAFGLADGDALAEAAWGAASNVLGFSGLTGPKLGEELGVDMPGDLATLLGDNLLVAVDSAGSGVVQVGARITTDAVAAGRVLDKLERRTGGLVPPELTVVRRTVGDDLVVAGTRAQADRLAADGDLGDLPAFRSALPDLGTASLALWADPAGVLSAVGFGGEEDPDLEPLDGVGLTVTSTSEGSASFRMRLVAH